MESPRAKRARRRFSEEFKSQTVRLVLDEGKSVTAVARELDLVPSAVGVWVKHALANRTKGRTGLTTAEREELAAAPQRKSHPPRRARHPKKSGGLLRETER